MNPNRVEGSGGPMPEARPSEEREELAPDGNETIGTRPETAPSKQRSPAVQLPADMPQADPVSLPTVSDDDVRQVDTATDASSGDRIEKQWVDKTKNAISVTKDDPYSQKNEVSKVKAEYIKTRFNKTIRIDGEAA